MACYNILGNRYAPSERPSLEDLQKFANAVEPLYKPRDKDLRDAASTLEGLFSHNTKIPWRAASDVHCLNDSLQRFKPRS